MPRTVPDWTALDLGEYIAIELERRTLLALFVAHQPVSGGDTEPALLVLQQTGANAGANGAGAPLGRLLSLDRTGASGVLVPAKGVEIDELNMEFVDLAALQPGDLIATEDGPGFVCAEERDGASLFVVPMEGDGAFHTRPIMGRKAARIGWKMARE